MTAVAVRRRARTLLLALVASAACLCGSPDAKQQYARLGLAMDWPISGKVTSTLVT